MGDLYDFFEIIFGVFIVTLEEIRKTEGVKNLSFNTDLYLYVIK